MIITSRYHAELRDTTWIVTDSDNDHTVVSEHLLKRQAKANAERLNLLCDAYKLAC